VKGKSEMLRRLVCEIAIIWTVIDGIYSNLSKGAGLFKSLILTIMPLVFITIILLFREPND
jgi:hypothetical protein